MESPGKFLKKEKETRNISLEEISKFTKVKERYLKATEEDQYELLPAIPYVKGFFERLCQISHAQSKRHRPSI
jgi:cytoskeletal protein RodZ